MQRIRDQRKKNEAEYDRLCAEISALERVLSEEKVRELDARFTATEKEAATLWREEERKWAEAGQKLAALLETFGELRSCGKHERSAGRRSATTNSHRS